jgi:isopropylmalate/homocitrate/citramalate synthase
LFTFALKIFHLKAKIRMSFSDNIAALLVANVEFTNDELELKVEAFATQVSAVTLAALKFETAIGTNEAAATAGKGLIDLAATIGTAFPNLTADQVAKFKSTIAAVYDNPDPVIDAAGQDLFNTAVDAIIAAQELSTFVDELLPETV